jgi:hypothetical protein
MSRIIEPGVDLSTVPVALHAPLEAYLHVLEQALGPRGGSLSLLGAAAAGTFLSGEGHLQNCLVIERFELERLRALAAQLAMIHRAIAPPLVLTPDFIRASCDSFPLELLEMRQQHRTIWGRDPFSEIELVSEFVRVQCERELKSMTMAMRQAVVLACGDDELLAQHQRHSGDGVLRVLRGLLWLKGQKQARPAAAVVTEIESLVARPLPGVRSLLRLDRQLTWNDYQALYEDLDALGGAVDGW